MARLDDEKITRWKWAEQIVEYEDHPSGFRAFYGLPNDGLVRRFVSW